MFDKVHHTVRYRYGTVPYGSVPYRTLLYGTCTVRYGTCTSVLKQYSTGYRTEEYRTLRYHVVHKMSHSMIVLTFMVLISVNTIPTIHHVVQNYKTSLDNLPARYGTLPYRYRTVWNSVVRYVTVPYGRLSRLDL